MISGASLPTRGCVLVIPLLKSMVFFMCFLLSFPTVSSCSTLDDDVHCFCRRDVSIQSFPYGISFRDTSCVYLSSRHNLQSICDAFFSHVLPKSAAPSRIHC